MVASLLAGSIACCLPATPAPAEPTTGSPGTDTVRVQVENGRLSIVARDATLDGVLGLIARRMRIDVRTTASVTGRVTARYRHAALADILLDILHEHSFALLYADGRPSVLWVVPGHALAAASQPDATRGDRSTVDLATLQAAMASDDSRTREEAVESLGHHTSVDSISLLQRALSDDDDDVRRTAIDALRDVGGDAAASVLASTVDHADPVTREDAVYALGDIGGDIAESLLDRFLLDASQHVRSSAREMLAELRQQP